MAYRLEIREKVRVGTLAGFLWYEEKSVGLGSRFVSEVEEMIQYISQNPFHFQVKYKNYREGIMKTFPYVVIYEVRDELIIISSVFPTKAHPGSKTQ